MNITLNDTPMACDEGTTVETLLAGLGRLQPGTALAINQTIVPRDEWATRPVCSGDDILLFQAIAGG
ncbi:MAG: sulfur carrier protein ThiS [Symbiopectobacterium sp.]|uniref:sulfur carrier protein ThiS n=1 Tax=Candidatus Symbiopectobacterium sp. 'North America' TaxID=2794574 RepID=UPI0018C8DDBC|nr:sulfur carrier protein ThiS [Candidatus Symbiopectobacterium sp. 'North America']MBG6246382.1 sulfur carrier protein ThiS [Candidatus Symbiopectobacterium sp. 'North America']